MSIRFMLPVLPLLALACGPKGPPPHGPGGAHGGPGSPPPEALTACEGKAEGDACAMGDDHEGTCAPHPGGDELACRPEGGPKGPPPGAP